MAAEKLPHGILKLRELYQKVVFDMIRDIKSFKLEDTHIILTGSVAHRILFPDFFNDEDSLRNIDFVILDATSGPIFDPEILEQWVLTHSYPQFGNYSLFFIDRTVPYERINLFIAEKPSLYFKSIEVTINGMKIELPSKEEIYLKHARDILLFHIKRKIYNDMGWKLKTNIRDFFVYLDDRKSELAITGLEDMWEGELSALKRNIETDALTSLAATREIDIQFELDHLSSLESYLSFVRELTKDQSLFRSPDEEQVLVHPTIEDGREAIALQNPYLTVASSEEYLRILNEINRD